VGFRETPSGVSFFTHINRDMKTFIQYSLKESQQWRDTPVGKHHVKNKMNITFHDDRMEIHHGPELKYSKKGDYSKPTNKHLNTAVSIISKLHEK